MNNTIQEGDIIHHIDYGFGIMKELPTFKGMQVAGIKSQCVLADELLNYFKTLLDSQEAQYNGVKIIPCTEAELRELWKAGVRYWETSGATITFEEWLENLKTKKGLNDNKQYKLKE